MSTAASTNEKIVVDIDVYKRRRGATEPQIQESPDAAQEAIDEIARYLLMAISVITARRPHR